MCHQISFCCPCLALSCSQVRASQISQFGAIELGPIRNKQAWIITNCRNMAAQLATQLATVCEQKREHERKHETE